MLAFDITREQGVDQYDQDFLLQQNLLRTGMWLMHEYAEQHHEKTHNCGYSEAHDRAQKRFDGAPWKNNY